MSDRPMGDSHEFHSVCQDPSLPSAPHRIGQTLVVVAAPDSRMARRHAWMPQASHTGAQRFGERLLCSLHAVSAMAPPITLSRKQNLYTPGVMDNRLYLVESGRIKISVTTVLGKECFVSVHARGDIVGESCLLGTERMEGATAMAPTVVRQISHHQFLQVLLETGLLEDYVTYIAERLMEQQQIIAHFISQNSEHRLASTLLRLARKLGTREADKLRIDQKITHEELAQMVGTTRSRVGYFLNRFRADGLIEVTGDSFLVVDEAGLDQYLQEAS